MSMVVLLGPQRLEPTLVEEVDRFGIDGEIAAITAGWQEREEEDDELRAHLRRKVTNLMLYRRCEEVFEQDEELFLTHRARQDRLRAMQGLYRLRLEYALEAARHLMRQEGDLKLLAVERRAAIEAVRKLDNEHLQRIRKAHQVYERELEPTRRPAVVRHRQEIAEILERCEAVAIAGGHVAILLNRLRLFGLAELVAGKPIFAWSAGAMATAERVVLFHDHPPQGAGNAEVFEVGLGFHRGLLPLPHARRRLQLEEPQRVALLARRFGPSLAVALDERACVRFDGKHWHSGPGTRLLRTDGRVAKLEEAA